MSDDSRISPADVDAGLADMEYEVVENQFGVSMSCSVPATYACDPPATGTGDDIVQAFESKTTVALDIRSLQHEDNSPRFYLHAEIHTADYRRISVKAWRSCVRIYPREGGISRTHLAETLAALEDGLRTDLVYSPSDNHE
jgi:hypothetical protein